MTKFQGYYLGWNRCAECGQPLRLVGNSLRHLRGALKGHRLVVRKKLEASLS
ncbi:hypothetical protein [uncultured Mediterranean phage uvDeep-CGR2-KM21-C338]|nr:hypothetical protein [uncultured Mediterranean phage uvDeep-CGR2-KM21-C338]